MNRERGPRHEDDDHSQSTNERDEPTDEEREEWIRERFEKSVTDSILKELPDLALFKHQAE